MSKIFVKDISDKKIISTKGTKIGSLYKITLDTYTGDLLELIVKPDMALDKSRYLIVNEYVHIPFTAVNSIKDYIVVDDSVLSSEKRST